MDSCFRRNDKILDKIRLECHSARMLSVVEAQYLTTEIQKPGFAGSQASSERLIFTRDLVPISPLRSSVLGSKGDQK